MAQMGTRILDSGDRFPEMSFSEVQGGSLTLPGDLNGHWSVLLIYRGNW